MQRGTIFADLHTHTTASDGAHTPTMLVQRAFERALKAIAVTDHDTVAGVAEARKAADERGMAFLSGIEVSATMNGVGAKSSAAKSVETKNTPQREVHILGYGVDECNHALLKYAAECEKERTRRAERIIARLQELGQMLTLENVRRVSGAGVIGRHHIAIAMRNAGMVRTVRDAFDKFLADDAPAAVPKWAFPADKAIQMIHAAGGVAILAHPARVVSDDDLETLVDAGLDGVEVHHPAHDGFIAQFYEYFAETRNLLASGGSDYHGGSKRDDSNLGRFGLVRDDFTRFLEALQQRVAAYELERQAMKNSSNVFSRTVLESAPVQRMREAFTRFLE